MQIPLLVGLQVRLVVTDLRVTQLLVELSLTPLSVVGLVATIVALEPTVLAC
jgi:hypothetical protein